MRRLLIVSPHFPPANTADMHRVRMMLPFFAENGWEVEVLAVSSDQVAAPRDPWLVEGLPKEVPVHRVKAMSLMWSRFPGLGTLGFRALKALATAGDGLLESKKFDLVYFSTTVFEVHVLGSRWRKKFDVPFVMDYQDPWVNDYYREHPEVTPPGGKLKYALADTLHRFMEPRVLHACSGLTAVSEEYLRQLRQRYAWLEDLPDLVLPFPGSRRDFDRLKSSEVPHQYYDPEDGNIHWVSVGRGGDDTLPVLKALFVALSEHLDAKTLERLRIHFIGTSYAPQGKAQPHILSLATAYELEKQVTEITDRIPFSDALTCMRQADALLAIGSDDPRYTASKIYPYLLSRRPLLALFDENSSVVGLIRKVGGAVSVPFKSPLDSKKLSVNIARKWLSRKQYMQSLPLDYNAFSPYTDSGSTAMLCGFLDKVLVGESVQ